MLSRARARLELALRGTFIALLLAALLALIGWLWAGPSGTLLALALAFLQATLIPVAPPRVVMRMLGALPLSYEQAPQLHALVARVAHDAGLARPPALYVRTSPNIEALSVDGARESAIALSTGALHELGTREMRAVLAHEIAHLVSGDIRIFRLAGALGGMVRALGFAGFVFGATLFALSSGAQAVPALTMLGFAAAPLVATLLEAALWRTREYAADDGAVDITGDPEALARALQHIERFQHSPWSRFVRGARRVVVPGILRTHPKTADRVRRLMQYDPGVDD